MTQPKQSATWWSFVRGEMTPQLFVESVAKIGYAGVEIAPEEYWPLIRDHGLAIATSSGHRPLEDGLNKRSNHARIEAEIRRNLDLAVKWQIPNLICFSGNRNGLDDATGIETTAESLARVAPDAEAAGVTLVLELLNSKVNHPDYQCDHTEWGVEVCRRVNSPRVKLLYDVYHMQVMEGDLVRTIQTHHAYFGHYHTAGNPGRNELNENQEINYAAVFRAIAASGYTGYIGHEFLPVGDAVKGLQEAFTLCKRTYRAE